jgi:hypothetical protein
MATCHSEFSPWERIECFAGPWDGRVVHATVGNHLPLDLPVFWRGNNYTYRLKVKRRKGQVVQCRYVFLGPAAAKRR